METHFDLPILLHNKQLAHVKLTRNKEEVSPDSSIFFYEAGNTPLFSTLGNRLIGHSLQDDKTFSIKKVSKKDQTLKIELTEGDDIVNPEIDGVKVEIKAGLQDGQEYLYLSYSDSRDVNTIEFSVQLNGENYTGEKRICFVPQNLTFDIAIDFGSEASQMTIWRDGNGHLVRSPLVRNLTADYYPIGTTPIHQAESDDLYRPLFFLKKSNGVFHLDSVPGTHNELLPLITRTEQADDLNDNYRPMSNLKLGLLGAYTFPLTFSDHYEGKSEVNLSSMVSEVQQKVINGFLHTALNEIRRQIASDTDFYVRVKLLVPNVLAQRKVSELINRTNNFLSKQDNGLSAFETNVICESDASFLGYWRNAINLNRTSSTRFIVIDMGKGTTDFSILSTDENYNITSEFRSGFVGAGNVITYAFIETIITFLFGKNEKVKRKAIKKYFLDGGSVFQVEFLRGIEEIKARYGRNRECRALNELNFSSSINEILESKDLSVINDSHIKQLLDEISQIQGSITDDYGYIEKAVNGLSNRVFSTLEMFATGTTSVSQKEKYKIILTGRSFLFTPLYNSIIELFISNDKTVEIVSLNNVNDSTYLKKICLEGAYDHTPINYGTGLIGLPVNAEKVTKSSLERRTSDIKEKREILNKSIFYIQSKWSNEFYGSTKDDPLKKEKHESEEEENKSREVPISNNVIDMILGTYAMGSDFNSKKNSIYVSGVHYELSKEVEKGFKLYYDGSTLYARTSSGRIELTESIRFSENPIYMFETLFPFNSWIDAENIVVQIDLANIPEL